uniref:Uncharacterized protein n=1 Tax=Molossus molossus TaxID=27622 RepID=A0A7J8JWM5_MOLMO|nr:hypothetical protein HJG59_007815 [Molossus molossus]
MFQWNGMEMKVTGPGVKWINSWKLKSSMMQALGWLERLLAMAKSLQRVSCSGEVRLKGRLFSTWSSLSSSPACLLVEPLPPYAHLPFLPRSSFWFPRFMLTDWPEEMRKLWDQEKHRVEMSTPTLGMCEKAIN